MSCSKRRYPVTTAATGSLANPGPPRGRESGPGEAVSRDGAAGGGRSERQNLA